MAKKHLVIVESPAKAKTIGKYLGKDYEVKASMGHLRDLPKSKLGVDIEHDFEPVYQPIRGKEELISELKKAAKSSDTVYLATDPDREGEAISWHLKALLNLDDEKAKRVTFNEITKKVVSESIKEPRAIDQDLVDAQQARRVLDRIVGYQLSPLLWKKVRRGLSAGRVQSVAVRMVDDREKEIQAFEAQEYWTLDADLTDEATHKTFEAHYYGKDGKKVEPASGEQVDGIIADIGDKSFTVTNIKRTDKQRSPSLPFTTSTLQQEASRKLNMTPRRTMAIAQQLYEGVDITGEGTVGLITYMRTDSLRISEEAIAAAKTFILGRYGQSYYPKTARHYKAKAGAQDAHEAIRPAHVDETPKKLETKLDSDAHKLYELIWKRTVACQMNPAIMDKVTVDATSADGKIVLRANGQVINFDGFLKLYVESKDDSDEDDENRILPNVETGESVTKGEIRPEQHFTTPPPRFTEASLVKKLEELGIGRPSTYASIIAVLQDRKYVRVEKLRFIPEDRGRIVTVFLENFFKKYVEYDFTAQLEEYLDDISNGEMEWKKLLGGFWTKFIKNIDAVQPLQISEVIEKIDEVLSYHLFPPREDGSDPRICPECGKGRLSIKLGKFGAFLGCSNYPECKYTKPLTDVTEEMSSDTPKAPNPEDKTMGELNGLKVYLKKGPYGFYIQLGEDATATTEKPKRVALPRNLKPEDVTPEQALILASLPRQLGNGIEANIGKFGQYLKQGNKSKSLTGNDNIFNITLERAEEILKNVAERPAGKILGQNPKDKADITVLSGRSSPYIKCGKNNYAIPREFKDRELTLEDALKIIAAKK